MKLTVYISIFLLSNWVLFTVHCTCRCYQLRTWNQIWCTVAVIILWWNMDDIYTVQGFHVFLPSYYFLSQFIFPFLVSICLPMSLFPFPAPISLISLVVFYFPYQSGVFLFPLPVMLSCKTWLVLLLQALLMLLLVLKYKLIVILLLSMLL